MASLQSWSAFFCRLVMAAFFVPAGLKYIKDFSVWADHYVALHAARNLPWPRAFLVTGIAAEVGCGMALLIGFRSRAATIGLILFTAIWSLLYHDFWAMPDAQYMAERIIFFKNGAIIGGLAMLAAHGPGQFSLDALLRRRRDIRPKPAEPGAD